MFNFVIITNKVTPETTKTIEILKKTKLPQDTIIVVNYNNYHIKYRSVDGIDYRQVKQSRRQAINQSLPKDANVVLLGSEFTVSKNFVKDLYNHTDFKALSTLRVDSISHDGKFAESDFRMGSSITTKSFMYMAMIFNTSLLNKVGETPEETAILAKEWGIPLLLATNIRVLKTATKQKISDNGVGITILVPSLTYPHISTLKEMVKSNDKIYQFESDPRGLTRFINQKIVESHNECIVIINPESKINSMNMLNRIRGLYKNNPCFVIDVQEELTDNAWLVLSKVMFNYTQKQFDNIKQLQQHILSYNVSATRFMEKLEKKKDRVKDSVISDDMISIIIPFMYNGDRWPLFDATIERLYQHTKDYDNIEIIIHETAPKRYIKPTYIEKYDLVYLFSEYKGLFHRAWSLNVIAKHIAKGNIFVFFDADLLVDEKWVNELLNCDKTIPYIGWGKMKNLNQKGTDHYLKTKQTKEWLERTREPSGHAAGGGINIIPRDMFFAIGGWPESYKDKGYGGEDNSLTFKMLALDMYDSKMKHW